MGPLRCIIVEIGTGLVSARSVELGELARGAVQLKSLVATNCKVPRVPRFMTRFCWRVCLMIGGSLLARGASAGDVDFTREIRPILVANCLECHGPDAALRQAELRLDERTNAFAARGDRPAAIVPGQPAASELWRRVSSHDPDLVMPPPEARTRLTDKQIAKLAEWIDAGAEWPPHWAYEPLSRPAVPTAAADNWSRSAVDRFTLVSLTETDQTPREEAERTRLLRRVTLDLTGVNPTPDEVAAFLADRSPAAFERVVDRLLASPRFGEHMATAWLDLARYADTHGYHADSHRDMWLWRDWVIQAFNQNMPFDRFTIEQLAGDLLPNATVAQRVASGFHRNTLLNAEEGAIPEEYLVEYVADRVNTTATVWLGQTLGCARCHDHKYDPFSQREFYRLFAFFHQVSEKGLDGRKGNAAPLLPVITESTQRQLAAWQARIAELERRLADQRATAAARQSEWEAVLRERHAVRPPADATWHFSLDESEGVIAHDARNSFTATWNQPITWLAAGKFRGTALLDGSAYLPWNMRSRENGPESATLSLWLFPTTKDHMTLTLLADSVQAKALVHLELIEGRPVLWTRTDTDQDEWTKRSAADSLELRRWQHVACVLPVEGDSSAPVSIALNGKLLELETVPQQSHEVTQSPAAGEVWLGGDGENGLRGMLDEVRWYSRGLNEDELRVLAGSDPIGEILAVPRAERTADQQDKLLAYYLREFNTTSAPLTSELTQLTRQVEQLHRTLPTTMVMDELEPPRETYVLLRGDYRQRGERVQPGVPARLDFDGRAVTTRLELAQWLVDPRHPLTARVAVNRLWQNLFGTGIVETSEDLGLRGELPSHPELLDWLAAEYIASGWDTKHMIRLIVTSATYRQSAAAEPLAYDADPENRQLARSARLRLPAESIRDSALLASGLLVERPGGPGVHPYQPPGLWEELAYNQDEYTAQRYVQSHGADLYRRSIYTFWKRTSPPAALAVLDAPNREVCVSRRSRTNTPLQALVLMNDPTYVEAARMLAARVMHETDSPVASVTRIHLHLLGREPSASEAALLTSLWAEAQAEFAQAPDQAAALLSVGEAAVDATLPPAHLAAGTVVALAVMNLDEFVTRP